MARSYRGDTDIDRLMRARERAIDAVDLRKLKKKARKKKRGRGADEDYDVAAARELAWMGYEPPPMPDGDAPPPPPARVKAAPELKAENASLRVQLAQMKAGVDTLKNEAKRLRNQRRNDLDRIDDLERENKILDKRLTKERNKSFDGTKGVTFPAILRRAARDEVLAMEAPDLVEWWNDRVVGVLRNLDVRRVLDLAGHGLTVTAIQPRRVRRGPQIRPTPDVMLSFSRADDDDDEPPF